MASASGVTRSTAGRRGVRRRGTGDACAEYAAVPEDALVAKPANLSFEQAAAVPRGRPHRPPGPPRPGRRPPRPAGPDQRRVGRHRHLRGADRQGVRRRGDRRVQPQERGPGPLARRRPGHRLHPAGLHPGAAAATTWSSTSPSSRAASGRRAPRAGCSSRARRPLVTGRGAQGQPAARDRWVTSCRVRLASLGRARHGAAAHLDWRAPSGPRPALGRACSRPGRSPRLVRAAATRCATRRGGAAAYLGQATRARASVVITVSAGSERRPVPGSTP